MEAIIPRCGIPIGRSNSPDGQWSAVMCLDNFTGVYNLSNPATAWIFPYAKTLGTENSDVYQSGKLRPVHWSADGQYLYLNSYPCCMDGGCPAYLDGTALFRVNLTNGAITPTLKPGQGTKFYNFSFSENDSYLAYFRTWIEHPILNLQNLITGEEQHIPLGDKYQEAGEVIWSPDGSQIAFSARTGSECENMTNYLVMMKLSDLSQTILAEGTTENEYLPIEWTEDNTIIFQIGYEGAYYSVNLATRETVSYQTPTPATYP